MRREGSPWQGLGRGVPEGALRSPDQRAHDRAASCWSCSRPWRRSTGPVQQLRRTPPRIRSCSCGCSPPRATSIRCRRSFHSSDFLVPLMGVGLGVRRDQRRAQPAHAEPHPGAADLSRRAAVREISRRARHARDRPARAVAPADRARPACWLGVPPGGEEMIARLHLPDRDDRLCGRVARARPAVLDHLPVGGDGGAGHARPVAVPRR